jgi:hypothetical protein
MAAMTVSSVWGSTALFIEELHIGFEKEEKY